MLLRRCKQNLLTLQATCSFVFDYSTRRLLDLLSKATPAGGIPLGGTVTFQFCTLSLGNSQVRDCLLLFGGQASSHHSQGTLLRHSSGRHGHF